MQDRSPDEDRINPDSSVPGYQQLAHILARQIVGGQLGPGQQIPKERELSATFGISRVTVRQGIRLLEERGLVRRVRGHGTYISRSDIPARWFSTVPTVLLLQVSSRAMLAGNIHWLYTLIQKGVREGAQSLGLDVRIEAVPGYVRVPMAQYCPPKPKDIGGVIVTGTFDLQYIRMFASEGVPLVVVDCWTTDMETDCVAVDVEAEAHAAVSHLVERGHTSLGFVASGRHEHDENPNAFDPDVWRLLDAVRRAARSCRVEVRDEWVVLAPSVAQVGPSVRALLSLPSRPTSLLCFADSGVVPVLEMANQGLIRCPEDISIIGRGDEYVLGRQMTRFTVAPELLGQQAVKLLAERMRGQRRDAIRLAIPGRFVRGKTTGPAPQSRAQSPDAKSESISP